MTEILLLTFVGKSILELTALHSYRSLSETSNHPLNRSDPCFGITRSGHSGMLFILLYLPIHTYIGTYTNTHTQTTERGTYFITPLFHPPPIDSISSPWTVRSKLKEHSIGVYHISNRRSSSHGNLDPQRLYLDH